MVWISSRDVKTLSEILPTLYATADRAAFPQETLRAVARVVPAEIYVHNEVDVQRQRLIVEVKPSDARFANDTQLWVEHMHEHPVLQTYRQIGDGSAYKISDFLSQREYHRLALYQEVYRHLRTEDQWSIALPSPSAGIVALTINRDRRSFNERDRVLLNLLRLHLFYAYQHIETATLKRNALALTQQEGITRREFDILLALSQGKTNKEIAQVLGLSPHTIRSRLEDLYGKLGVNTRTAAVRWFLERTA